LGIRQSMSKPVMHRIVIRTICLGGEHQYQLFWCWCCWPMPIRACPKIGHREIQCFISMLPLEVSILRAEQQWTNPGIILVIRLLYPNISLCIIYIYVYIYGHTPPLEPTSQMSML
jgi:hypothetical protein